MADVVANLTTESTWYIKSLSLVSMKYARLKITGNGSNNADTVVQAVVSKS
jgi:hypothetical protein